MTDLFIWTAGVGKRVVCVHGSGGSGQSFLHVSAFWQAVDA